MTDDRSTKVALFVTLVVIIGGCLISKYMYKQTKKQSQTNTNTQPTNTEPKTTTNPPKTNINKPNITNSPNLDTNTPTKPPTSQNDVVFTSQQTTTTIIFNETQKKTTNGVDEITSETTEVTDTVSINNSLTDNNVVIQQSTTVKYNLTLKKVFNRFTDGLRFGISETQGKREKMENVCEYIKDFNTIYNGKKPSFCFLLFDGHLGVECATKCKNDLPSLIANELKTKKRFTKSILYCDPNQLNNNNNDKNDNDKNDNNNTNNDNIHHINENETKEANDKPKLKSNKYTFYNDNEIKNDPICQAIRDGFIKMDEKWKKYAKENKNESGATAVFVLLIDNILYVANIGDSRAVLCNGGSPVKLTEDHTPKNENEIERAREYINTKNNRIGGEYGELAVTRAFGDYVFNDDNISKMGGLTVEPHIKKMKLESKDEFLLIACDGIWDVVSNSEAISVVRRSLRSHQSPTKAADKLVKYAIAKKTTDNVSAMVIGFGNRQNDGKLQIVRPINNGPRPPGRRRFGKKLNL